MSGEFLKALERELPSSPGLGAWLPERSSGPLFGLDRTGGIQRQVTKPTLWERICAWWPWLFRQAMRYRGEA